MRAQEIHNLNSTIGLSKSSFQQGRMRGLPVTLLPSRLILFAFFQLIIAALVSATNGVFSYQSAGIYWPYAATATNIITFLYLNAAFKRERLVVTDLYRFSKATVGKDILATVVVLVVAVPLSLFPNSILASVLFGSPTAANHWLFGPMPGVMVYLTVLLPLTIAFVELPLYMGYILPRLSMQLNSRITAVLIAGIFLALQHCSLPLIFDVRFIIWRFGVFLPLALLFAFVLSWRPRLMPYMMIMHAMLDFGAVGMIIYMSSQR